MLLSLNLDIHQDLLGYLELPEAVSILSVSLSFNCLVSQYTYDSIFQTSRQVYLNIDLWIYALKLCSKERPLACPPRTNLRSLDHSQVRSIAFRSAAVARAWSSRSQIAFPKFVREVGFKHVEEPPSILAVIPGTALVLTSSRIIIKIHIRREVQCYDLLNRRCVGSVVCDTTVVPYVRSTTPCTDVPGIYKIAFICQVPIAARTHSFT